MDAVSAALKECFGSDTLLCECVKLPSQASSRTYFRLSLRGSDAPTSVILVKLPDDPFASDEAAKADEVAELPFCSMQRFLDSRGIRVPRLYYDGTRRRFLLQEDLGDTTLFKLLASAIDSSAAEHPRHIRGRSRETVIRSKVVSLYEPALNLLVAFQASTALSPDTPERFERIPYSREFSFDLLRWELDHFKQWGLLDYAGARLSPSEDAIIEKAFDDIAGRLCATTYIVAHRDFQSTNLMQWQGKLVLIDFQDALLAPPVYDIVALLRDSYVELTPDEFESLLRSYYERGRYLLPVKDWKEFEFLVHLQTLQRKLKDAGRFVFIDRTKGNPSYLKWVEPTLGYVKYAFDHLPEYESLRVALARWFPTLR